MKLLCCVATIFLTNTLLSEQEHTCKRCEIYREYNKEHPNPYVYYDDWLKAHEKEMKKEDVKENETDKEKKETR